MKQLQYFISMFTRVTTGTTIACAVMLALSDIEVWTVNVLWHILIVGAVTALITVVVIPDREYSRREGLIRFIIHYLLISATVLVCGWLFEWYVPNLPSCAVMMICITAVYAFTYFSSLLSSKRTADEINRALEKRRSGKNK